MTDNLTIRTLPQTPATAASNLSETATSSVPATPGISRPSTPNLASAAAPLSPPRRPGAPLYNSPMGGYDSQGASTGMGNGGHSTHEVRKLIVGREIALSGEINACDYLVIEGNVNATVRDGHKMEITDAGHFKGTADVVDAEISGKFEGNLAVSGRLRILSSGRVEGKIEYAELEIEAGGQIIGEIAVIAKGKAAKAVNA